MSSPVLLDMPQASVVHYPGWVSQERADGWLDHLRTEAAWKQDHIQIQGSSIALPRLTAWHGDVGTSYGYSGIKNEPSPWFDALRELRQEVEIAAGVGFNSVLLNLYRNGRDSVAWHADNEHELGPTPVIASVSLGATRQFSFKHKTDPKLRAKVMLAHGDLLIMRGSTQKYWLHQVPKTTRPVAERLNLTFRQVLGSHA